jgi:hypothetical protein
MNTSKYTDIQILSILKENEYGISVADLMTTREASPSS